MSPNTKERLILSVAGGVVIPSSYFVGIAVLAYAGVSLSSATLLLLPLIWPGYVYHYLFPVFLDLQDADAIFIVGGTDFVFYSVLTYAVIRWRQRMPRLR